MGVIISIFADDDILIEADKPKKDTFNKPKFYKTLEGPVFTTLDYNKIYATRHYNATVWVSTIETIGKDIDQAWRRGKQRLLKYFRGNNQSKYAMHCTCPIVLKIQKSETTTTTERGHDITLSMPLPHIFSEDPPAPKGAGVFINHGQKRIYYTGYFHKQWDRDHMEYDINILENTTKQNGDNYNNEFYYLAVYDIQQRKLKMSYYEYWFEGSVLNTDFTCLQTLQDCDDENKDESKNHLQE